MKLLHHIHLSIKLTILTFILVYGVAQAFIYWFDEEPPRITQVDHADVSFGHWNVQPLPASFRAVTETWAVRFWLPPDGLTYVLQYRTEGFDTNWYDVNRTMIGNGKTNGLIVPGHGSGPRQFRIMVKL